MSPSTIPTPQENPGADQIVPGRFGPPALPAAAGFLIPGLGHILCGQDNKGVFLFGLALLGGWATAGFSFLLLSPLACLDAWAIARKIRTGHPVKRWEFFPNRPWLNRLAPHVLPRAIFLAVLIMAIVRAVAYGWDYPLGSP
jgi:hypothetical protein